MSTYSDQRQANINRFKDHAKVYESDSMQAVLHGCAKSVLTFDQPDRSLYLKTETLGDPSLPGYGLDDFLPPIDDPVISELFTSGKGLKMMDFACGTGLMVKYMAPYLTGADTTVVGVDISPAQIDMFNSKLDDIKDINPSLKVKTYCYDLIDTDWDDQNGYAKPAELEYGTFDIITTTLSFHHFSELDKIVVELHKYLKPDGHLIIVDLYDHKDEYVPDEVDLNSAVAHHGGFSPAQMEEKLATLDWSKVEAAEKYYYEHWCNKSNLENHLPKSAYIRAQKEAPSRQRNGQTEWLVKRSLVLVVCKK